MTEKEIIQALRCGEDANGTPRPEPSDGEIVCYDPLKLAAADLIARLTAENAVLREKVPQWVSVEERLPIDRLKKYLVAFRDVGGPIVDMASYFPSDGWTCDNWDVPQNLITHWMPLPEAPEEGEKA